MSKEMNETVADDIMANIVSNEPEVTIESLPEEVEKKDKFGRSFDSDLHNVDEFGVPKLLKNGDLSVKRGQGVKTEKKEEEVEGKVDYRGQGMMLAKFTEAAGCLMSEDFKFVKDKSIGIDEEKYLGEAFGSYLEAKGIDDIPPGYMLMSALAFYVAPRLVKEKQKSKLKKVFKWIGSKIGF